MTPPIGHGTYLQSPLRASRYAGTVQDYPTFPVLMPCLTRDMVMSGLQESGETGARRENRQGDSLGTVRRHVLLIKA